VSTVKKDVVRGVEGNIFLSGVERARPPMKDDLEQEYGMKGFVVGLPPWERRHQRSWEKSRVLEKVGKTLGLLGRGVPHPQGGAKHKAWVGFQRGEPAELGGRQRANFIGSVRQGHRKRQKSPRLPVTASTERIGNRVMGGGKGGNKKNFPGTRRTQRRILIRVSMESN